MDKFFFSDRNVNTQCSNLENILNIRDNDTAKQKCKKFLVQNMKDVYKKYGSKRPENISPKDFMDLLNKKSIKECVKLCEQKKQQKSQKPNQISQYKRQREEEIYGDRNNHLDRRPQYSMPPRNSSKSEPNYHKNSELLNMPLYSDANTGISGFASINPNEQGEFINANGEMSNNFFRNETNNKNNRRGGDELESEMYKRIAECGYNNKNGGFQNNFAKNNQMENNLENNFGDHFMGSGIGSSLQPQQPQQSQSQSQLQYQYNPNIGFRNDKPEEINFALDGTDTRRYTGRSNNNAKNQMYDTDPNNDQNNNQPWQMNNNQPWNNQQNPMDDNQPSWPPQMGHQINYTNRLNDNEIKMGMEGMQSDRRNFDQIIKNQNYTKNKPNFGMSPNMNYNNSNMNMQQMLMMQKMYETNNNYLNCERRENTNGVREGVSQYNMINSFDNDQLNEYMNNLKKTILNKIETFPDINYQIIQNLNSKQINDLINKISSNIVNINTNDEKQLVNTLFNIPDKIKSSTNYDDILNNTNKNDKMVSATKKNISYHTITINSRDYAEPEFYSDYLVKLQNQMKNITCFELISVRLFPEFDNIKNNKCLRCKIDGTERVIHIDRSFCSIEYVIHFLKENIGHINIDIDQNKYITISVSTNCAFELNNDRNSILKLLGFVDDYYYGSRSYKSEQPHKIEYIDKVYLYIDNVEDEKPFAIINTQKGFVLPVKKSFDDPVTLDDFAIQFKIDNHPDSKNYYDFKGYPHELVFKIHKLENID
jgi:hypothetical protein